jgi:hypothetical protein
MALGKFLRGFFASPAANCGILTSKEIWKDATTHSYDFCPCICKHCLYYYASPAKETAFRAAYAVKLDKWSRVLPVAKTDTIMVGTTAKVKNDAQDDKADNGNNLDGTSRSMCQENGRVVKISPTRK